MGDEENKNGWPEYQRMIMAKLDTLESQHRENAKTLVKIQVELATLKAKAAIWGGLAGTILGGVIALVVKSFTK